MAYDHSRAPLGSLPTAANAQLGQSPVVGYPAAGGQENMPIPVSITKEAPTKKRKSTEAHVPADDFDSIDVDDVDVDNMFIDQNCDQVRRKINNLLDSRVMTKTAFAAKIGVSAKSLNGFLGLHGRDKGSNFAAYDAAWAFFKKCEIAGIKLPKAKKQKTSAAAAETTTTTTAAPAAKAATKKSAASTALIDLSDVSLAGEATDTVPVFDSCDEVRKKINAYLQKPGVTQAQFCRDLYAQLQGPSRPAKPFQSTQLARFRGMKGPNMGANLPLFYAAYVFFEKVRVKEGKPKSKHRLGMEKAWGRGGMNREGDGRRGYWCRAGESPHIDAFGRVSFH